MEASSNERLTLSTFAQSFEALSSRGLLLRVELEDEVTDFLVALSNSEEDTLVGRAAVIVESSKAASVDVEELSSVHFFFQ